jgi:hypothetical protein
LTSLGPRAQVAVLVVAAILAGAGVGALVVTLTRSDDGRKTMETPRAAAPVSTATTTETGTGTPPTVAAAANPPAAEAVADVEAKGYAVQDTAGYAPQQRLSVLVGVLRSSADGTAQKAFFFADGAPIGTDTAEPSAAIRVVSQSDDTIGLRYALYDKRDPQCCPTAGDAIVSYHWDGQSLQPLQTIPTGSLSADNSRR